MSEREEVGNEKVCEGGSEGKREYMQRNRAKGREYEMCDMI